MVASDVTEVSMSMTAASASTTQTIPTVAGHHRFS
jgi:hypothetical protein